MDLELNPPAPLLSRALIFCAEKKSTFKIETTNGRQHELQCQNIWLTYVLVSQ